MNDQTWIFGKAISPLFADRVTIYNQPFLTSHDMNSLMFGCDKKFGNIPTITEVLL